VAVVWKALLPKKIRKIRTGRTYSSPAVCPVCFAARRTNNHAAIDAIRNETLLTALSGSLQNEPSVRSQ
jgi:hypothetical protein